MSVFANNAAMRLFEERLLLSNCLLIFCEVNFRVSNLFGFSFHNFVALRMINNKDFFFLCLFQRAQVFVQR